MGKSAGGYCFRGCSGYTNGSQLSPDGDRAFISPGNCGADPNLDGPTDHAFGICRHGLAHPQAQQPGLDLPFGGHRRNFASRNHWRCRRLTGYGGRLPWISRLVARGRIGSADLCTVRGRGHSAILE